MPSEKQLGLSKGHSQPAVQLCVSVTLHRSCREGRQAGRINMRVGVQGGGMHMLYSQGVWKAVERQYIYAA